MRRFIGFLTAPVSLAALVLAGNAAAQGPWGERQDDERRSPRAASRQHSGVPSAAAVSVSEAPRLSVIVATRDRPELLERCLASVLANDHDDFELIVVDQSDVHVVLPSDSRIRHVRTGTVGKSAALNIGIREARAAMLAFTDDDCTAPRGWLTHAESLLLANPELEMAFGALVPIEHDPSKFHVQGNQLGARTFRIMRGRRRAYVRGGAGANLVARRRVFDVIGEWDEQIGPGSAFKGCEEWDIYYRALASGAAVALSPRPEMLHCGIRSLEDSRVLAWGYAYGEGAVIGKHLRLADFGMVVPALGILLGDILDAPRRVWHRQRPGARSFVWKCRGIVAGVRHRVDRERRVFVG
jgi:GT2 family glycosyltransferase